MDYFVLPIPHHGSCPKIKSKKTTPAASVMNLSKRVQQLNTTVLLRRTENPPLCVLFISPSIFTHPFLRRPELREPPPLTPQGEVVKPQPEKSFLQKYWMYIGAFALILRMCVFLDYMCVIFNCCLQLWAAAQRKNDQKEAVMVNNYIVCRLSLVVV